MKIRLSHILLLVLTLLTHNAYSQPKASSETVESILAKATRAVGNPNEIAKIKSIDADADCVGPQGKYTTSISSFRDNRTRFEQTYSYRAASSTFINGSLVWGRSPEGALVAANSFQRMAARSHEYQKMAFDLRSFFSTLEFVGDDVFDGMPSLKIRGKNELGMTTDIYFDKKSGRMSGYVLHIPDSTETIKNVFLEWRKVGKVMLPSLVRATDRKGDWTLNFHTIKLNAADERPLNIQAQPAT